MWGAERCLELQQKMESETVPPAETEQRSDDKDMEGDVVSGRLSDDEELRFWAQVNRAEEPEACWLWQGRQDKGWGRFWSRGKYYQAQRIVYELTFGPIPPHHVVLQRCGNRLCVKPQHILLQPVTPPIARGEAHGQTKLSNAQVITIRERYAAGGVTLRQLGREFNVDESTIRKIVRGERHTDAPGPLVVARAVVTTSADPALWKQSFLEAIRAGATVRAACKTAGISNRQLYKACAQDAEFARAYDVAKVARLPDWKPAFLAALQQGASVRMACRIAGIHADTAYTARRTDTAFATAWQAAQKDKNTLPDAEVRQPQQGAGQPSENRQSRLEYEQEPFLEERDAARLVEIAVPSRHPVKHPKIKPSPHPSTVYKVIASLQVIELIDTRRPGGKYHLTMDNRQTLCGQIIQRSLAARRSNFDPQRDCRSCAMYARSAGFICTDCARLSIQLDADGRCSACHDLRLGIREDEEE